MPLIDAYATARGEVGNEHFSHECLALREQIRTKLLGEQASKRAALTDEQRPDTCLWTPEDDEYMPGTYRSACGELWSFVDGDIQDNRVKFCQGCGGKIVEAHITGEKT